MKWRAFLRRTWWVFLLLALLGLAWWGAFSYLIDFRTPDVVFQTTPNDVVAAMLDMAEVTDADTVYDLGSGDGRVLIAAARRGAKAVGYEIDPELVEQSRAAVREAGLSGRVT